MCKAGLVFPKQSVLSFPVRTDDTKPTSNCKDLTAVTAAAALHQCRVTFAGAMLQQKRRCKYMTYDTAETVATSFTRHELTSKTAMVGVVAQSPG